MSGLVNRLQRRLGAEYVTDVFLLTAQLVRWGASATGAMSPPDASRFEALQDQWDEMERRNGHTIRALLAGEFPEPGEHIADVGCPCCGERIRIQYGDDPGEIGALGPVPKGDV